jgi:non-ribosomal peptide synthase protein (TIGR01720 family)
LFGPLIAGRAVTIVEDGQGVDSLVRTMRIHLGFALLKITPTHLAALNEMLSPEEVAAAAQTIVLGGENLHGSLVAPLCITDGPSIFNEYGPTETTVGSLAFRCRALGCEQASVPIGTPIANTRVYLLDRDLQPVPDEVTGQLYIAGMGVARGYRNLPGQTATAFLPDPFSQVPGERMYRTGDLALRKDGALRYVGRISRQLKIRGYRVEPGEIEAAILSQPSVASAAVVLRRDASGISRLVAFLVTRGSLPTYSELKKFLASHLPEYMIPTSFIRIDTMPIAPGGKIDYDRLCSEADDGEKAIAGGSAPSSNEAERALLDIWKDLLNAPAAGVLDNFFQLGGDSILAIRMAARARRAGIKIHPGDVFEHPTIVELAAIAHIAAPSKDIFEEDGSPVPLLPIQRWFFENYSDTPDGFCQTRSVLLNERVSLNAVEEALSRLMERHDALRLRFSKTPGGWTQIIATAESARLAEAIKPAEPLLKAQADCIQRLSITRGPLLGALLVETADDRQKLFLAVHHLAVDHLSWLTIMDELEIFLRNPKAELSLAGIQFSRAARLLDVHLRQIDPETSWLQWAADKTERECAESGTEATSDRLLMALSETETGLLLREVHGALNTEVPDFLVTALGIAFARVRGVSKLRVDMESNGRSTAGDLELLHTVGWLTSVYPVNIEVRPEREPLENLVSVKDQLRRVQREGRTYEALRYFGSAACREALSHAAPPMSFNYLGPAHHETSPTGMFSPLPDNQRSVRPRAARRVYRYEINAVVGAGRLLTEFIWSSERDARPDMGNVAATYLEELRRLIRLSAECEGPGCTPADFKHVSLDSPTLNAILKQLALQGGPVHEPFDN